MSKRIDSENVFTLYEEKWMSRMFCVLVSVFNETYLIEQIIW